MKRQIHCKLHQLLISECEECYPVFLVETTVGDLIEADKNDGKSETWRTAADALLDALARDNKYIVADMLQIFLESAGYDLLDYSPLGGVFRRGAKRGIIKRIDRPTKQTLWHSQIYKTDNDTMQCVTCGNRTSRLEANTRNYNTGCCGNCGGNLEKVTNHA